MAISFVAAGATVTGVSPTVPVPAGYAEGDLLVVFFGCILQWLKYVIKRMDVTYII